MKVHATKVIRDWGGRGHLTGQDLNIGTFRPEPGQFARVVLPNGLRTWDSDVPRLLARAVAPADDWCLDSTRPEVAARLAAEIDAALAEIRARS